MTSPSATIVPRRPMIMAHYMPWYESKPVSGRWGWHWTMGRFDPDRRGMHDRQDLASPFRPLIGAYDTSDPDTLACHTSLMKMSGIDGVFMDWYGTMDLDDFGTIHRHTLKLIDACSRAGLRFSFMMEDQMVPRLLQARTCTADEYALSALDWMEDHCFPMPGYLRWQGRPVLLLFGPQFFAQADLHRLFGQRTALFTLLERQGPAIGAFGWPAPQVGEWASWTQLRAFYERTKTWDASIALAYPRFHDIYEQAGAGCSYGRISDRDGRTFRESFSLAISSGAPFVQIASWNDWGEGTQIEPSEEFGYRDLEMLQAHRRSVDPDFAYDPSDLRRAVETYRLRKDGTAASIIHANNDAQADAIREPRTAWRRAANRRGSPHSPPY
jgi:hypothetical protein